MDNGTIYQTEEVLEMSQGGSGGSIRNSVLAR